MDQMTRLVSVTSYIPIKNIISRASMGSWPRTLLRSGAVAADCCVFTARVNMPLSAVWANSASMNLDALMQHNQLCYCAGKLTIFPAAWSTEVFSSSSEIMSLTVRPTSQSRNLFFRKTRIRLKCLLRRTSVDVAPWSLRYGDVL